jgi:membrane-associated phospholipid phosphatase
VTPTYGEAVSDVVADALDPTAPTSATAPIDLPAVAPPARDAPGWLPWVGLAGALGAGALVVMAVRTGGSAWPVDRVVHTWVLEHRAAPGSWLAATVTWGGATTVVLPALAVVGALLPRGRRALRDRLGAGLLLSGTAALGVWLGLALNHTVGRERPPSTGWWGAAGGPAFPSGHTTAATIAAGTLAWALTTRVRSRTARATVWAAAAAYALVVGGSRVWLGVHWPSDVVGGWLLGASWVALVVTAVGAMERRWSRRQTGRGSAGK